MLKLKLTVLLAIIGLFSISSVCNAVVGQSLISTGSEGGGQIAPTMNIGDKEDEVYPTQMPIPGNPPGNPEVQEAKEQIDEAFFAAEQAGCEWETYFKVSSSEIIDIAEDFLFSSGTTEIPEITLRLNCGDMTGFNAINELENKGYTVQSKYKNLIQVTAPINIIFNTETGLQTFDWINQASLPAVARPQPGL